VTQLDGSEPLHIGRQQRTLKLTARACAQFKAWTPGHVDIRTALAFTHDPDTVATAIAAMLLHEEPKITPGKVMGWVDDELPRFEQFEAIAQRVAKRYFQRAGIIEADPPAAPPSTTTTAPSPAAPTGSPSSSSADGTASTPGASQT